jgi:nucleoside-diphosphate-sugar epimerase
MKNVLITGGAGFIGSNLVQRCIDMDWDVTIVDDLSNGHIDFVPDGTRAFYMDFTAPDVLNAINNKEFDVVFHLAAKPRVGYSVEHPVETNDTNVSKTLTLMTACIGNIDRFIFASSSSVYGVQNQNDLPTHEESNKNPQSPYALQKLIIENYLRLYHNLYGLDSACMRFFNVFGPNQLGGSPYATAISAWLTAIKEGRPMRSDGDGTQTRDMCYVDNVTDALVRAALTTSRMGGQPFNVACGESVSNNDVMAVLTKRYPEATKVDAPARVGDVKHTLADITSISQCLGYEPLVRVWDGIERTIEWYEQSWDLISDLKLNT